MNAKLGVVEFPSVLFPFVHLNDSFLAAKVVVLPADTVCISVNSVLWMYKQVHIN